MRQATGPIATGRSSESFHGLLPCLRPRHKLPLARTFASAGFGAAPLPAGAHDPLAGAIPLPPSPPPPPPCSRRPGAGYAMPPAPGAVPASRVSLQAPGLLRPRTPYRRRPPCRYTLVLFRSRCRPPLSPDDGCACMLPHAQCGFRTGSPPPAPAPMAPPPAPALPRSSNDGRGQWRDLWGIRRARLVRRAIGAKRLMLA